MIFVAGLVAALAGCASQSTAPTASQAATATDQQGACIKNFTTEGSFWTGTRYSTFEEFPNKTANGAFDALLRSAAANGYQIVSSNKEAGMISASQTVSYGQGKTAPLNIVIQKSAKSGIRVDISFSTSGGVSASVEGGQKEFCKLLASVGQSANEATSSSSAPKAADNNTVAPKKKSPKNSTK